MKRKGEADILPARLHGADWVQLLFCLASCLLVFFRDHMTGYRDIILFCTVAALSATLFLLDGGGLRIRRTWLFWTPYFAVALAGIPFSQSRIDSIKVFLVDSLLLGSAALYDRYSRRDPTLFRLIRGLSAVFTLSVIAQLIAPSAILEADAVFMTPEQVQQVENWYNSGFYTGFTIITGVAAYFCVVWIAASVSCLLFARKHRAFWLFPIALGILALLLTKKRGHFLGALLMIAAVIVLTKGKKARSMLLVFGGGMVVLLLVLSLIPQSRGIYERFLTSGLSGREYIYAILLRKFRESPVIGIGLGSSGRFIFGNVPGTTAGTAHNEYLRVLCETGVLGFIAFTFAVFYQYGYTIRQYRRALNGGAELPDETLRIMAFSLCMQTFILLHALTENPLSSYDQLYMYFLSAALGNPAPLENGGPDEPGNVRLSSALL